jgi:hypothetical protein
MHSHDHGASPDSFLLNIVGIFLKALLVHLEIISLIDLLVR